MTTSNTNITVKLVKRYDGAYDIKCEEHPELALVARKECMSMGMAYYIYTDDMYTKKSTIDSFFTLQDLREELVEIIKAHIDSNPSPVAPSPVDSIPASEEEYLAIAESNGYDIHDECVCNGSSWHRITKVPMQATRDSWTESEWMKWIDVHANGHLQDVIDLKLSLRRMVAKIDYNHHELDSMTVAIIQVATNT
jgi:hypothetical protein